ncbi:MAG: polysaccharide deacetylase family protein [Candidatus Omnitrophica bacterium]|nr:polysaccharide deacetylase family protein [Candidatus Omnitrophota bacterium]
MIKKILKSILLFSLSNDLFIWFYLLLRRNKLRIIAYHGVSDVDYEKKTPNVISRGVFEKQLKYLKKHYRNSSLPLLTNNECRKYYNGITITFDDGYENNYKYAVPLLLKYGFTAIFFVNPKYVEMSEKNQTIATWWDIIYYIMNEKNYDDFVSIFSNNGLKLDPLLNIETAKTKAVEKLKNIAVDKCDKVAQEMQSRFAKEIKEMAFPGFMNWQQLKEIKKAGMDIGAHTMSHVNVSGLSLNKFQEELAEARNIMETQLNASILYFAFPLGKKANYSYEAVEFLRKIGHKCALLVLDKFDKRIKDNFCLNRIPILKNDNFMMFKLKASGIYDDINTLHRFIKFLL